MDDSPQESVINYFKTFFDTHFKAEDEIVLTPLQSKLRIVMDYCVSDSISEVIIKWVDFEDNETRGGSSEINEKTKLIGIKLIDINQNPYFFISRYQKEFFSFRAMSTNLLKTKISRCNLD